MQRKMRFETLENRRVMTAGATQISGIATLPAPDECTNPPDAPEGTALVFTMKMEGDLDGCFYSYAYTNEEGEVDYQLSPSGTYRERGIDIYVSTDGEDSFETNYLFTAKFDEDGNEIWGRCQHPINPAFGEGAFEGITGRINFRDDVEAVTFPYKGHLRPVNSAAVDAAVGAENAGSVDDAILASLSALED